MSVTKPSYPWAEGDALFASELNAAIANAGGGPYSPITIGDGTGAPTLTLDGATGTTKGLFWRAAGAERWRFVTDTASENLNLFAFNAAGAFTKTVATFANDGSSISVQSPLVSDTSAAIPPGGVAGLNSVARNTGSNVGQGVKFTYFSTGSGPGFDIGQTSLAIYDPTSFTVGQVPYYLCDWMVCVSPNDATASWAAVTMEMDISNRGPDMGWKRDRTSLRSTGALLLAAENNTFGGTGGGEGKNASYALAITPAGANNSTGFPPKFYNGIQFDPNSIVGLTGRAIYATGDITGTSSQYPYGPFQTEGTWLHGFDHTLAVYTDNHAQVMKAGQGLAWITGTTGTPGGTATITGTGSGADASITLAPAGAGSVALAGKIMASVLQASATYANDAAAASGGVAVGQFYRNGSVVQVRVA